MPPELKRYLIYLVLSLATCVTLTVPKFQVNIIFPKKKSSNSRNFEKSINQIKKRTNFHQILATKNYYPSKRWRTKNATLPNFLFFFTSPFGRTWSNYTFCLLNLHKSSEDQNGSLIELTRRGENLQEITTTLNGYLCSKDGTNKYKNETTLNWLNKSRP